MTTSQTRELKMLEHENIPDIFGGYGSGEGWGRDFFSAYSLYGTPSCANFTVGYTYTHDDDTLDVTGMADITLTFGDESGDYVGAHLVGEDELFYGMDTLEPLLTIITFIAGSQKLPERLAEDVEFLLGEDEVTWYTPELIEQLKSTRVLKELSDYSLRTMQLVSIYTLGEYSFAVYPRYPIPYVGRTNLIAVFKTGEEEKIISLLSSPLNKCIEDLGLHKGFAQGDKPTGKDKGWSLINPPLEDKAPKPKRPVETLRGIKPRSKNTK